MQAKALILTTSHAELGDTGKSTGFYWEELAVPYWALRDAGYAVDFASVEGGMPPADPNSVAQAEAIPAVQRFLKDPDAMAQLAASAPAASVDPTPYAAVFLPGGHGTMWDLAQTDAVGALVAQVYEQGGVVGAVCHGPAGLVGARLSDGKPLVAGRRVNGFTDAEEAAAGLTDVVPYLLERRLRELGAVFEASAESFQPHAVRDGRLVTGQNPASSERVGDLLVEALRETQAKAA